MATIERHTSTHDLWPGEQGKEKSADPDRGKDTDWDEPESFERLTDEGWKDVVGKELEVPWLKAVVAPAAP